MAVTLPGGSVWDQKMYNELSRHVAEEGRILERYRELAEHSPSEAFSYLAGRIVEDEERHHRWMTELAETIRASSELTQPPIPPLDLYRARPEVLAATKELLDVERADRKELRHLKRELADYRDTTLWALIVELMMIETDKHIAILDFIRTHSAAP